MNGPDFGQFVHIIVVRQCVMKRKEIRNLPKSERPESNSQSKKFCCYLETLVILPVIGEYSTNFKMRQQIHAMLH